MGGVCVCVCVCVRVCVCVCVTPKYFNQIPNCEVQQTYILLNISETMSPRSSGPAGRPSTSTLIHSFGMWERLWGHHGKQAPALLVHPPQQTMANQVIPETLQQTHRTRLQISQIAFWHVYFSVLKEFPQSV